MEQKQQITATMLHNKECPVGYECLATDCVECLKIHMEKGTEDSQKKEAEK